MEISETRDRLLAIAKDRLVNFPGAFTRFKFEIDHPIQIADSFVACHTLLVLNLPMYSSGFGHSATVEAEITEKLVRYVDKWAQTQPLPNAVTPLPVKSALPIAVFDTHAKTGLQSFANNSASATPATLKKIAYLMQRRRLADLLQYDEAFKTAQLLALPTQTIDELCTAEFEKERERAESFRFYIQSAESADFAYLLTLGYWSAEETIAVFLNKNPDKVNWHFLKEYQAHDEQENADFQSLGIANSNCKQYLTKQYLDLVVWLSRAEVFISGTRNVDPVSALRVAKANGLSIPAQMETALSEKEPQRVQRFESNLLADAMPGLNSAPVVADGASGGTKQTKASPLPLTTSDIAFCFAGLRWDEKQWKKPLGDKPKWLLACIAIPAVRGVSESRWNPVLLGASLVRVQHVRPQSVRAKFQTQPLLKPWLDEWKTYEADNLSAD